MARKEFLRLLWENVVLLDRLSGRVKRNPATLSGVPRQQATILVRLYMGGGAKLKDIAAREMETTANLCTAFRKMERDGLVTRTVDDNDRRNTWYALTDSGQDLAKDLLMRFHQNLANLFAGLSPADESVMISSLKTMNDILTKMESKNA